MRRTTMATVERDSGTRPSKAARSYPPDLEDSFGTGRDAGLLACSNAAMSTRVGCQGVIQEYRKRGDPCRGLRTATDGLPKAVGAKHTAPRELAMNASQASCYVRALRRFQLRGIKAALSRQSLFEAPWNVPRDYSQRAKSTSSPPGIPNVPASAACSCDRYDGGGRGIRTPETLTSLAVFKTAAFNHSAIPPRIFSLAVKRVERHPLAMAIFRRSADGHWCTLRNDARKAR